MTTRTEAEILADLEGCEREIQASRDLIRVHEERIVENEAKLLVFKAEMNEFDHAQAQAAKPVVVQWADEFRYGRGTVRPRRPQHPLWRVVRFWARYYGSQAEAAAALDIPVSTFSSLWMGDHLTARDKTLAKLQVEPSRTKKYRYQFLWEAR